MKISKNDALGWLLVVAVFSGVILVGIGLTYIFRDPELSAGRIITDTKTGCQYVAYGSGVTPRLDTTGKQICPLPRAK